jgi:hypothetical protein
VFRAEEHRRGGAVVEPLGKLVGIIAIGYVTLALFFASGGLDVRRSRRASDE